MYSNLHTLLLNPPPSHSGGNYPFPAHIGAPQIEAHGPSIRSISACAYKRTDAVFFNSRFYKGKSGISADFEPFRERNRVIGACAFIRTEFSFEKSLFFNRFVYRRMRLYARERGTMFMRMGSEGQCQIFSWIGFEWWKHWYFLDFQAFSTVQNWPWRSRPLTFSITIYSFCTWFVSFGTQLCRKNSHYDLHAFLKFGDFSTIPYILVYRPMGLYYSKGPSGGLIHQWAYTQVGL